MRSSLAALAPRAVAPAARPARHLAAELVFGSWTPAQEYQNRVAMPELFRNIEKDTNGAIKWKLIAGGQIADGKTTFTAVKDGLMQAGLGIVTYVPNAMPSVYAIYSTVIFGENDPVAATRRGAGDDVSALPVLPRGVAQAEFGAVLVGGWTISAYVLACREPLKTMADLKGKRVRATGGNAEMLKMAGMVPVGATLVEAVGLLQRGGLDCQHGIADWLRTFGYADVAKYVIDYPLGLTGPALGFFMNRDTWNELHARAEEGPPQARRLAERQDGDRQLHHLQRGGAQHRRSRTRACRWSRSATHSIRSRRTTRRCSATPTSRPPRASACKDPAAIIDTTRRRSSAGGRCRRRSAATSTSSPRC